MFVNFKMMKFNGLWSLLRSNCFNPNCESAFRTVSSKIQPERLISLVGNVICASERNQWLVYVI